MNLKNRRVVLTGASGGIGREVVQGLLDRDASIVMVGRSLKALKSVESSLKVTHDGSARELFSVAADITQHKDRQLIVEIAKEEMGEVDVLINLAGAMSFTEFSVETEETTEELFQSNVLAPMHLTRLLLPGMVEQGHGEIVNVGSIFGSIAFAWFTTYSSTKFALRGFSEALRRELRGSGVGVSYIAPRAVRTPFNSQAITEMCEKTGAAMDEPGSVAKQIIQALEKNQKERYLGFPEKLFVRINNLFPRLVDHALEKQNRIAKRYVQS